MWPCGLQSIRDDLLEHSVCELRTARFTSRGLFILIQCFFVQYVATLLLGNLFESANPSFAVSRTEQKPLGGLSKGMKTCTCYHLLPTINQPVTNQTICKQTRWQAGIKQANKQQKHAKCATLKEHGERCTSEPQMSDTAHQFLPKAAGMSWQCCTVPKTPVQVAQQIPKLQATAGEKQPQIPLAQLQCQSNKKLIQSSVYTKHYKTLNDRLTG